MSQFIESIKVENQKAFLLDLHQQRVEQTFAHFGKECRMDLAKIFKDLEHDEDGLYKFRLVYDLDGNFKSQLIPYAFPEIETFELVENNDFSYNFKFLDRTEFEKMKKKARAQEIIIVKNGHLTDTSFSNLLFLKGQNWYTPSTYLLNGVQRQNLLKKGIIKEAEITTENLKEFSHFQLINAMNEFNQDFVYSVEELIEKQKDYLFS